MAESRARSRAQRLLLSHSEQTRCRSRNVCGPTCDTSAGSRSSAAMRRSKRSAASGPRLATARSSAGVMRTSRAMRSTSISPQHDNSDAKSPLAQSLHHRQTASKGDSSFSSTGQVCHLTLLSSASIIFKIDPGKRIDLGQTRRRLDSCDVFGTALIITGADCGDVDSCAEAVGLSNDRPQSDMADPINSPGRFVPTLAQA